MKKIFFVILVLWSAVSYSQAPNYNNYNVRNHFWQFSTNGLNIPAGATPVTLTGQYARSGALYYDTTGVDTGLYVKHGVYWVKVGGAVDANNGTSLNAGIVQLGSVTALSQYTPITLNGFPLTINHNGVDSTAQSDSNTLRLTNNTASTGITSAVTSPGIMFKTSSWRTAGSTAKDQRFMIDATGLSTTAINGNSLFRLRVNPNNVGYSTIFSISAAGIIQQNLNVNGTIFGNTGVASGNVIAGSNTLLAVTTATGTVAVGDNVLTSHKTGDENTAVGYNSLFADTSGANNTAIGARALFLNKNGSDNTAVGQNSLRANTTGTANTAVGMSALGSSTASSNTAVGHSAMSAVGMTGGLNTAVGVNALKANTTGTANVAIGMTSLQAATTAIKNTALGAGAMEKTTTGGFNSAFGEDVMLNNLTGINNVAGGWVALGTMTAGNGNVAFGFNTAVTPTGGDNNIWLGRESGTHASQALAPTNSIAIGYNSFTTASNQIVIGNSSHTGFQAFGIPHNTPASATMLVYDTLTGFFYHQAIPTGGGGSGVTTMTAFGSTPNANAGTISGSNLTLQPSDGTNPGGISLSAQTMGDGRKTFLKQAVFPNGLSVTGARTNADGFVFEYVGGNTGTLTVYNGGFQDFQVYANNLHFYGNGANPVSISSGGNLGVGVVAASTTEKLHVAGNVRFSGALMPNNAAGTSGQILQSAGAATVPTWVTPTWQYILGSTAGGDLTGAHAIDGGTGSFTWQNFANYVLTSSNVEFTNKVGIGSTAATSLLQVNGSFATAYRAITALRTLDITDHTIECTSGTYSVTLPTAAGITGRQYVITNSGSGVITIATTSSQTFINVTATPTTLTVNQYGVVTVVSNGANWLRTSSL